MHPDPAVSSAEGATGLPRATCNAQRLPAITPMNMERRVRFELLYGEHAPAVKAYVLRRAQASVADDLVAEVFMVCWRRLDELPAEPLPWLLGVARRVLSTQRRGERRRRRAAPAARRERRTAVGLPRIGSGAGGGPAQGTRAAQRDRSRNPAADRLGGALSDQAAAVLGVKAATVRVRLHRARRRLARALLREGGKRGEEEVQKGERRRGASRSHVHH